MFSLQGKLRIGLGEESVVSALAHAQLLHREGGQDKDGALANRLERAVQSVKQAVSQCPSYDVLIPALLKYPLEVTQSPGHFALPAEGSETDWLTGCKAFRGGCALLNFPSCHCTMWSNSSRGPPAYGRICMHGIVHMLSVL